MKLIFAKFKSTCHETGREIKRGDTCLYDRIAKKVYCKTSQTFRDHKETESTRQYIEAGENAYFDNFCQDNNI